MIENRKGSVNYGQEVSKAVTILEAPPLKVIGVKAYRKHPYGSDAVLQIWATDIDKELQRTLPVPKKRKNKIEKLDSLEGIDQLRLVVHTQPYKAGFGKKKPEVFEIHINGSLENQINIAKEKLGKEIDVSEVFSETDLVDTIGVTKGHGFQGAVKRWGVKLLAKKSEKVKRKAGNLGAWHPHKVQWTVPQAGQMGFFRRTEYNKQIFKIDNPTEELNNGGWKNYGVIKSKYIMVSGSVQGPSKRLIVLREALRKPKAKYDPVNIK